MASRPPASARPAGWLERYRSPMSRLPLIFFLVVLSSTAHGAPATTQRLVVVAPSIGESPEPKGKGVAFFPSEVVTVLATKGTSVLVRGDDDATPAWLPRTVLADASSFRPVAGWNGARRFELSSSGADSGQTYYFKPDGTFRAEFDDNHNPRKWSGRLYRNGQIVWARPNAGSPVFGYWSVFRQLPSEKLCVLNFDTLLGCECVGTYNSGFVAACK